ncbi:MAG TPA: hypothetical protein VLF93_05925 [Candidatus Saccharimonadales bacterium]|nr:hypothetical protein [Candidatus Saccharimonadales bacterium]
MERSRIKSKEAKKKARKSKLDRIYSKKPLLEFIVAALSVPSLILILILNYNTIKSINNTKPTPTPVPNVATPGPNGKFPNFFSKPITNAPQPSGSTAVSQGPCNKHLGPVSITSPNEGDTINSNPVEVDISYDNTDYCSAVWAYSINGSNWSNYDDNSVALYNLPNGPVRFQLKVKSLTSSDTTTLTRDFTYTGQSMVTPATASGSAQ